MDTENINLTVCKLKQCLLLLRVQRISIIEKSQALENGRLSVFVIIDCLLCYKDSPAENVFVL